eukprot:2503381-Prymnesium_polylepis.1
MGRFSSTVAQCTVRPRLASHVALWRAAPITLGFEAVDGKGLALAAPDQGQSPDPEVKETGHGDSPPPYPKAAHTAAEGRGRHASGCGWVPSGATYRRKHSA